MDKISDNHQQEMNRREFLKKVGVVTASAMLASAILRMLSGIL